MIKMQDNTVTELLAAAQNVTASWANVGDIIDLRDVGQLCVWPEVDINDALNFQIRVVAEKTKTGSDSYTLPIKSASADVVKVEDMYYEFNVDSDQKMVLDWDLDDLISFGRVQIKAGTAGASPGQLDSCGVSKRNRVS